MWLLSLFAAFTHFHFFISIKIHDWCPASYICVARKLSRSLIVGVDDQFSCPWQQLARATRSSAETELASEVPSATDVPIAQTIPTRKDAVRTLILSFSVPNEIENMPTISNMLI
jgi:hypothetical protein